MPQAPLNLLGLNKKIKAVIRKELESYWVIAEISEMSVNYSGHCYLEFIQKEENSERIVSRARAIIWNNVFRMIQPYFETTTGKTLGEGLKIMVRVTVEFHEVYGLSLSILDIEPTYTVGEAALRKQKIIEKLTKEGVYDMNKEIASPTLPKRLAIISSKTAAGYGDFVEQLMNNPFGFKYYCKLFPAIMQGNEAENSIINQLDLIFNHAELFDAVIIIRGGGAQADMDCFNNYWLAFNIAQFPLPVFTGIGHEQDDSVVDMVANTRLKTPTAVAEYLLDRFSKVAEALTEIELDIMDYCRETLASEKTKLLKNAHKLQSTLNECFALEHTRLSQIQSQYIARAKTNLEQHRHSLTKTIGQLEYRSMLMVSRKINSISEHKNKLKHFTEKELNKRKFSLALFDNTIQLNNPKDLLKKGYSITSSNGKVVKEASKLKPGDEIETLFYKGKKRSIVKD